MIQILSLPNLDLNKAMINMFKEREIKMENFSDKLDF